MVPFLLKKKEKKVIFNGIWYKTYKKHMYMHALGKDFRNYS